MVHWVTTLVGTECSQQKFEFGVKLKLPQPDTLLHCAAQRAAVMALE